MSRDSNLTFGECMQARTQGWVGLGVNPLPPLEFLLCVCFFWTPPF